MPGPGVTVTTDMIGNALSTPELDASDQLFLVGLADRGITTEPILVRSMAEAEYVLGARTTYGALWDTLRVFFAEGGTQAWVVRLVGATATKGTLTVNDRAGSPLPTLRFDAASAGSFSALMRVQIMDGSVPNTYRVIITLNGTVVEDANNLATPAAAVTRFAESPHIRVVNLASATVAPNNNPAVLASTALSAGNDQRGTLVAADYVTGLAKFTNGYGSGAVAIPGMTGSTIWTGINAHCIASGMRIGLMADAQGASKATLLTNAATIGSEWVGLFAPWVSVTDDAGGSRAISPEGYVAACRARAHNREGPWRVPAGHRSVSGMLMGIDGEFSTTDANDLDAGGVSTIRTIANTIRLYGWRSLSYDKPNWGYLKDRDVLNYLVAEANNRLEDYVFEQIDGRGRLLAQVNAEMVSMLEPMAARGAFFPLRDANDKKLDNGYVVYTGAEINTPVTLAANEIHALIQVRISPTGGLVALHITKVGLLTGMTYDAS